MIAFAAIPMLYRVLAIVVAAVLISAVIYGSGYTRGVKSMADDLAEARTEASVCNTALHQVQEINSGLLKAQEKARSEWEKTSKEASNAWSAVLDWSRSNPRIVRIKSNCGDGKTGTNGEAAGGTEGRSGIPSVDSTGTIAEVLSIEEINIRLAAFERDAARLAWIIERDNELTGKGLLK